MNTNTYTNTHEHIHSEMEREEYKSRSFKVRRYLDAQAREENGTHVYEAPLNTSSSCSERPDCKQNQMYNTKDGMIGIFNRGVDVRKM